MKSFWYCTPPPKKNVNTFFRHSDGDIRCFRAEANKLGAKQIRVRLAILQFCLAPALHILLSHARRLSGLAGRWMIGASPRRSGG